ncbi:hypothetical protein M433DRAFT_159097 [Acidomyces richmondensis BFW]|nr:MAG: hypothetical protein FE78DRAFT_87375 [Acidomyces sp. 'richmondensis']KYG41385.1 hypothetical protein M433DRAFT_159097 [Acidomyces richmondensis BFW]
MNFNFGSKSATTNGQVKKPVITRKTVHVPVAKTSVPTAGPSANVASARPTRTDRFKLTGRSGAKVSISKSQAKSRHATLAVSRGLKRKSATPDPINQFSDDGNSSSEDEVSDDGMSHKKFKSSMSQDKSESGLKRRLLSERAFKDGTRHLKFVHSADAISGESVSGKYYNPWDVKECATIELQYPSKSVRERFQLKLAKDESDYKPMADIVEVIKVVSMYYFPDELQKKYLDEETGFERRLRRSYGAKDIPQFINVVQEYNHTLQSLLEEGTIEREISRHRRLDLVWIEAILNQINSRTVSSRAEILNRYKSGSDNVYGELLPPLISNVFKKTKLSQDQIFIDLGSGIGNVVLQAALEVGCESWGIEMMKNPCDFARLQAAEFEARTQLWGLDVGSVNLLEGDMTLHPEVPKILQRADVVLVNNQAFTPALNEKLINMFLDLKEGAQVVSLKPFVPEGHKMALRNVDNVVNQFRQEKLQYWSSSVSWSHNGNGSWYVATKDLRPLNEFRRLHNLGNY